MRISKLGRTEGSPSRPVAARSVADVPSTNSRWMTVLRCMAFGALIPLVAGCHQGEDHPWYEWEMVIPYSSAADYPMMGAVSRYDTLADCRKQRTAIIRNIETWGSTVPDPQARERHGELVRLLRHRTWCLLAWPDTARFEESAWPDSQKIRTRLPRDTPEHRRWLERWRRKGQQ